MLESGFLVIFMSMMLFSGFEAHLRIMQGCDRSPKLISIRYMDKLDCDLPTVDIKLNPADKPDTLFISSITGRCLLIFLQNSPKEIVFSKPGITGFLDTFYCGKVTKMSIKKSESDIYIFCSSDRVSFTSKYQY